MGHKVERYHDISCGHRVVGHEGKCRHLHGHNYRITFVCEGSALDGVGRIIDFGEIKLRLCEWLEEHWDHKFLFWEDDPLINNLAVENVEDSYEHNNTLQESLVMVPFNPTAEKMAEYLADVVAPEQLKGTGIIVTQCRVEETRKCSATYSVSPWNGMFANE